MDNNEKIRRGDQARALLDNEFFKECLAKLEARYIEAWRASPTVEKREEAHRYVMMIEWFADDLKSVANTGDITRMRMDALQGKPTVLSEFKR